MAFQIKDFRSIAASMINWMRATQQKVTDFNQGSVARTLVEAPAAEIDELYQQMFIGLKEGIEASVFTSFGFDAITELPATGLIRVTVAASPAPIAIAAGTSFSLASGEIEYLSNSDTVIPAGSTYIDVLVACSTPGAIGNIQAGQSFSVEPAIDGLVSAENLAAFITGVDTESSEDRKLRFNGFISSLPRGTLASLAYGVKLAYLADANGNKTERVASSSIVEPWLADSDQPISLVECYIHNGSGGTSGALVTRAREVIYGYYDATGNAVPGWKAAGVNVQVFAATELPVPVAGVLTTLDGYDKAFLTEQCRQVIYTYILSLGIGQPVLVAELVAQVMGIDGVSNIVFSDPTLDVPADQKTKLMPGVIALT